MIRTQTLERSMLIIASALAMAAPSALHADTKTGNKTLGSADDVWRIELRDADALVQLVAGDRRRSSEISRVTWRLSSGDQFHQSVMTREELTSATGAEGPTYVSVSNGQIISADIPEVSPGTQLWVHTRQQPETGGGVPVVRFVLEITARDLDCIRRRSCRRGDTGTARFEIEADIPAVRSQRCIPQNSLRLRTVQIGEGGPPSGDFERVSGGLWGGAAGFIMSGRPILAPSEPDDTHVTICIASTRD